MYRCPVCSDKIISGDVVVTTVQFQALSGIFNGEIIKHPHIELFVFANADSKLCHQSCIKSMFIDNNIQPNKRNKVKLVERSIEDANNKGNV